MFKALQFFWASICVTALLSCGSQQNEDPIEIKASAELPVITISAVGDIMMGSTFPDSSRLPPNDGLHSFNLVKKYLKGDIVFGNLEGVLLDGNHPPKCIDSLSKNCYVFKMPQHYATILKDAGFNLISLANNHISDFKAIGRKTTSRVLDSLKIAHAGLLTAPSTILKKNGITYGFAAFSPNSSVNSMLDIKKATEIVEDLKRKSDIVIISFHGGAEGTDYEHISRQNEFYIGENRGNVYAFAHTMVDAGADLILGHGPHVTRAVEVYKDRLIAYSLGNFLTYGKINILGANGIAPLLNIELQTDGKFVRTEVVSTYQTKTQGVLVDSLNRAFRKLKNLTDADFQGHGLDFSKVGLIRPTP